MNNKMQGDPQKLRKLGLKNKKLLESISSYLVKNSDETQQQSHRILEHKYRQLITFNQENVSQNQKMQEQLTAKNRQLQTIKNQLSQVKQQAIHYQQKLKAKKGEEEKTRRGQQLLLQQSINKLKEENREVKSNNLREQRKIQQQIRNQKQKIEEMQRKKQKLNEEVRVDLNKFAERVKQMELVMMEQKTQINRITKHNQILQNDIDKKGKKNVLEGVKELIGDYRKRNM